MDPVIGRKNEIERVIQILCRLFFFGFVTGGHEVEDGCQLLEGMNRLALDEVAVLFLAKFVFDFVDREF
jgi:hypothetical protein